MSVGKTYSSYMVVLAHMLNMFLLFVVLILSLHVDSIHNLKVDCGSLHKLWVMSAHMELSV